MIVLINSSKTMNSHANGEALTRPMFQRQAKELDARLKTLSQAQLIEVMHISESLAGNAFALIKAWNTKMSSQSAALDAFQGDIFRGLDAGSLTSEQRQYANETLRVFSGLYGLLRPFDGIMPYRLEQGYRLALDEADNLYQFWGDQLAARLPKRGIIVNLASKEYFRTVKPFLDPRRIIEPQFETRMTMGAATGFVAVHAKVARGAFARWLIVTGITEPHEFGGFSGSGYRYDQKRGTVAKPVFVLEPPSEERPNPS